MRAVNNALRSPGQERARARARAGTLFAEEVQISVNVYLFAMQKHLLDAAFSRVDDAAAKEVASKSLIPAQCTRAITRFNAAELRL